MKFFLLVTGVSALVFLASLTGASALVYFIVVPAMKRLMPGSRLVRWLTCEPKANDLICCPKNRARVEKAEALISLAQSKIDSHPYFAG